MFMKFENNITHDEIMDKLRIQAENRHYRHDENSPWAMIAC